MARKPKDVVRFSLINPKSETLLDNLIALSTRLTWRAPTPEELVKARAVLRVPVRED